MIRLTISADILAFDRRRYSAAMREAIRQCMMRAGQKFLLAAIPRVPIWAGMARGAFRNAEDLFGQVTTDARSSTLYRIRGSRAVGTPRTAGHTNPIQYSTVRNGRIVRDTLREAYYNAPGVGRIRRTPEAGRQFATPTDEILDTGQARLVEGRSTFYFRYKIDISYFTALDTGSLGRTVGHWGAFKAGETAFVAYMNANLNLPNVSDFIVRKRITRS